MFSSLNARPWCLLVAVTLAVMPVRTVLSHYSFTAEFTAEETATLTGVVKQVWFRNPHVRYVFTVSNEDGVEETWDARGSPVVWLARKGWTRDTIKVGDSICTSARLSKFALFVSGGR